MFVTNCRCTLGEVLEPATEEASAVWICSGYVSPAGCEALNLRKHASSTPIHLTVGLARYSGLVLPTHSYLSNLHSDLQASGGGVRVASTPTHSKLYAFEMKDGSALVWVGSSNCTHHGLSEWTEGNIASVDASGNSVPLSEAKYRWHSGIPLPASGITVYEPYRGNGKESEKADTEGSVDTELTEEPATQGTPGLTLSHLAKPQYLAKGKKQADVPPKARLNWWNAKPRPSEQQRGRNQAYVHLPQATDKRRRAKAVFGGNSAGTVFEAVTHDGKQMRMNLQGADGKQITSAETSETFGSWILRDVLKLSPGTQVTRNILENYGRTDIDFYRLGVDDVTGLPLVLIDFSV